MKVSNIARFTAIMAIIAVTLTGCGKSKDDAAAPDKDTITTGTWPRTVTHENGETEIKAQPKKIVSTAVSLTGTLLAIDAPVIASSATKAGDMTDDKGFFSQWAKVADERGVKVAYENLELNLEAVTALNPDLIVVSAAGADSVVKEYEQLSKIAPTIVVDYKQHSWQEQAAQLGEATGLEDKAKDVVAEFDQTVQEAAKAIKHPEGSTSIVWYQEPGEESAGASADSPYVALMTDLGFQYAPIPAEFIDEEAAKKSDVTFFSAENFSKVITGDSIFLLGEGKGKVAEFLADPILQNMPAIKAKQVYPLGENSFRLDYYSSLETIELMKELFK